jgi:hypothetical protein
MARVPGYDIIALRNGSPVQVKSGSVTREAGNLGPSWELTLAEPLDISRSDTWTIKRKVAGRSETLVEDAKATTIGGQDGVDSSSRRVSGEYGDSDTNNLLEFCIPKTLVFVNMNWARRVFVDAMIMNGMLVHGSDYIRGIRILHPRLPGKEIKEGEYECIAGCNSHHACAQYLADLAGYAILINTPDIALVDTYTVPAGTTWREAIERNFKIWFPVIEVVDKTIIISDVSQDLPPAIQTITLTNDAIESASLNKRAHTGNEPSLDYLIITGRRTTNSEELYDQEPDFTPTQLAGIQLQPHTTIETSRSFSKVRDHKSMGDYDGVFGMPGEQESKKNLNRQIERRKFHIDESEGRERYILVGEEIHTYDEDDVEVAKTVITYTYSQGLKPIKTVEDEYVRTKMPGSDQKQLHKLRSKITLQDRFVKPLQLTLTTELVEGVVLYEEVEKEGELYKVDPQIMADMVRSDTSGDAIDSDPDTTQRTLEMTLNERSTFISRTFDNILIKRDQDYNRLSGHVKTQSQILDNPMADDGFLRTDDQFRKEYHADGSGFQVNGMVCYHPPKTIHHDDITTEAIADQIAARAFFRKSMEQNDEWTIQVPVPFLPQMVATTVRLPSFQVRINGNLVTISGGDFMLRQATESFSFQGDGNDRADTSLVVRPRY